MDDVVQHNLVTSLAKMRHRNQQKTVGSGQQQPQFERIKVDGEVLSYATDGTERCGVYIAAQPLSPDHNFFEVELLESGHMKCLSVGLVPPSHPLDRKPGRIGDSIGYQVYNGRLIRGRGKGVSFGPKVKVGDRIGCGIKFDQIQDYEQAVVPIFFTRNGKEIGSTLMICPADGLHPSVGLLRGDEIRLLQNVKWMNDVEMLMAIDCHEEDWSRLHDVHLNGQILEYTGRGKNIGDVGLAQARWPLDTTSHYFEIEILDPGESCYIAIGLARRDYPQHRHPGWNKGSIAYHADDGKIFDGSGAGDAFGPLCHKGDIMGCGILFPPDYVCTYDSDGCSEYSPDFPNGDSDGPLPEDFDGPHSESEDEFWWNDQNKIESGTKVEVFFTRNGKTIGRKEVYIPKGGFYPTVGMLSLDEKVKVDLRPLSG